MSDKKKKTANKVEKVKLDEPLKIDKTFEEAIRATMISANKKIKKSA